MLRQRLSRFFEKYAQRYVPGDRSLQRTSVELMRANREAYCKNLIKGLQEILGKFDSGLVLEAKTSGDGNAILEVSSPVRYPKIAPVKFDLSTQSNDFLMVTGREAIFTLRRYDGREKSFYYGDSYKPDNHSQLLGLPPYLHEVVEVAHFISAETYDKLYDRLQKPGAAQTRTAKPL